MKRIGIVLFLIAAVLIAGCIGDKKSQSEVQQVVETPVPSQEKVSNVSTQPEAKVETIKCELCHTDPQELSPHVNGGKLCVTCHGSQVHNIHLGPGTVGLQCESCHGFPPKVPVVQKGVGPGSYSVCEQCHAPPPDSLKPSNGDLVSIHLSRAKYCTNCHGTDIGALHAAKLDASQK